MDTQLVDAVDAAIAESDWGEATALLARLYQESASPATAAVVIDRARSIPRSRAPYRLFVARSFTIEPAVPLLRASALLNGVDLEVDLGDFGTYAQDLLDPSSRLYSTRPDAVLLAVQTRDVLPALWSRFPELDAAQVEHELERCLGDLRGLVDAFRARSQAHLLIQGFELPARPLAGVLDAQSEGGQAETIRRLNRQLVALSREHHGVFVVDYDGLVARHGRDRWHDEGKWLSARMPVAAPHLPKLAEEYLRTLLPLAGRLAKALVVDLDNTLWGGVVGEDGIDGLRLDPNGSGAAYLRLQRAILGAHARGVILAVASKNNPADAMEVLERHPAMLLRPHHFAAMRVSWQDKAQSLREIAEELNIGVDAIAFLDDSKVERHRVRAALPEVTVIDLPEDPMGYADALLESPTLQRLALSGEDRDRGRMYTEQRARAELQRAAPTLEEFWRSLQMSMDMREAAPEDVPRIAQLTQKTNQFNLTGRRSSDQEVAAMAADQATRVYGVRVRDRFGENGLVGVAITRDTGRVCEIETLLLSCRVIGRTVESAMLARLSTDARARGCRALRGVFRPTDRNAPASRLYADHGFIQVASADEGSTWERDLEVDDLQGPEWISTPNELANVTS